MSGCLDHCRLPEWECLQVGEKRNAIASVVAGAMVHHDIVYFRDQSA